MTAFDRAMFDQVVKSLRTFRERGVDGFEQGVFAQREFTALLPLRAAKDGQSRDQLLRAELERFAAGNRAFIQLAGLHSARWVLLDTDRNSGNDKLAGVAAEPATGPLLFALICDGWPLDVLDELVERGDVGLDPILRYCEGYPEQPTPEQRVAYLRGYRIRSSYLFADARQRDTDQPHLHASANEIRRALELRKLFVEYVVKNQYANSQVQQQKFQSFAPQASPGAALEANPSPGYPFAPSMLERPLDHEGLWVRRTAEIVRVRARRDGRNRKRKGLRPAGLRQVHAKHYGLMQATFRVCAELPRRLCAGVFVPGVEYAAWVRPSSTSPLPQPDYVPDGHGLSIKLLDVGKRGKSVLAQPLDDGLDPANPSVLTQDFVLVSHPTFFIKDARDYAILRCLFDGNPDGRAEKVELLVRALLFGARRPRELSIFFRTLLSVCRHPLAMEYHSMVPVLVGPSEAVKFSLRPTEATRRILFSESLLALLKHSLRDPNNYLRLALQRSLNLLDRSMLEFEFVAHTMGELSLSVEDARADWDRLGAKRVVIATLAIPRQDATSDAQRALGERMVFTPWHALQQHRPLGSLNRSRLFSYLASVEERSAANRPQPPLPIADATDSNGHPPSPPPAAGKSIMSIMTDPAP